MIFKQFQDNQAKAGESSLQTEDSAVLQSNGIRGCPAFVAFERWGGKKTLLFLKIYKLYYEYAT